jgi:hypothetical protein
MFVAKGYKAKPYYKDLFWDYLEAVLYCLQKRIPWSAISFVNEAPRGFRVDEEKTYEDDE